MNFKLSITSFLFCIPLLLSGIGASITHSIFYQAQEPYIEIYTRYLSDQTEFDFSTENMEFLVKLEALLIIKSEASIVIADKFIIESSLDAKSDIWDLKRYNLAEGQYEIELVVNNLLSDSDSELKYNSKIKVLPPSSNICISEPLLLSELSQEEDSKLAFEKQSFKYEPLAFNLATNETKHLQFYLEAVRLNNDWDESYYISYALLEGTLDSLGEEIKIGYKRMIAEDFKPLLLEMDISDIVSGNYTIIVEARDKEKKLLDKKNYPLAVYHPSADIFKEASYNKQFENSFVQILNEKELDYSLKAISSQVGNRQSEILNYVVGSDDIRSKKYYLYNYWSTVSSADPEKIYKKYMEVAKAVDKQFYNTVGYGFETDMGYIFLKYGKPNDMIAVEDEPSAPPYQIWIYNYVPTTQQNNVKFLFYNPSLSTNDYVLLHSTCRGEVNNRQWELELYRDAPNDQIGNPIDGNRVSNNWNRNARRYFEDN